MSEDILRPIERVVIRLEEEGANLHEISRRIGKRPITVRRIREMAELRQGAATPGNHRLRPIERVVIRLRSQGESYGEIGNRIARSGRQVQNIERFAELKLNDS